MLLALVFAASFWVTYSGLAGVFDAAGAICCVVAVGVLIRLAATVEGAPPTRTDFRPLRDRDLPRYSLLVPLNDEAGVVPDLCAALARLDYPAAKLEVLFLVEARDRATRFALERHLRPETQRIVRCPPGEPRTKPRALNIGLALARGDLVVIYDAEDEPAADQLRLAAARFATAGPRLACLQAALAVYNDEESRLARLFRLEYAALFQVVLPGLARMGLPIPLGGTSNHFRRDALMAAGGWDAWNVTEDADLGLRLAGLGYEVDVLASETVEAAPEDLGQWFPQRTRWFKGWIQTSIVASRLHRASWRTEPLRLFVTFGHGWSTVVTALVSPAMFLFLAAAAPFAGDTPRARFLVAIGVVVFAAGALALAWPILLGAYRARIRLSAIDVLLLGPYLALMCAAAWTAVWELLVAPHHWNKTRHDRAAGGPVRTSPPAPAQIQPARAGG
jgi:cellulose synthase/poly-beta-1,6-N-acetylglucosamine synthase-like glycosyltransferase